MRTNEEEFQHSRVPVSESVLCCRAYAVTVLDDQGRWVIYWGGQASQNEILGAIELMKHRLITTAYDAV